MKRSPGWTRAKDGGQLEGHTKVTCAALAAPGEGSREGDSVRDRSRGGRKRRKELQRDLGSRTMVKLTGEGGVSVDGGRQG